MKALEKAAKDRDEARADPASEAPGHHAWSAKRVEPDRRAGSAKRVEPGAHCDADGAVATAATSTGSASGRDNTCQGGHPPSG